jgi:UDP-GlcNAc:undecaprenyl-phosphate GlcNAc-1-phosphate transferase
MGKLELIEWRLFPPAAALLATALIIPLARRVAWDLEWVARPATDRWHTAPVPLLGGAVVIGVFCALAGFLGAPLWVIAGALVLCAVGLIDDVISLPPRTKLICELPLAILAALCVKVPVFLPWGLQQIALAFWILTAINAFNLIDGLDGLAAGLGIIASFAVAVIALAH